MELKITKVFLTLSLMACLITLTNAQQSLKNTLKITHLDHVDTKIIESQLKEQYIKEHHKDIELKESNSKSQHRVKQPRFVELEIPFSAGPYYDFLDAFLLGVKLETFFSYSKDCIMGLVYTLDDFAYLDNNDTLKKSWEEPVMNFTRLVAGNMTRSIPLCYQFGISVYTYNVQRFAQYNNNWGDFFLAFLFNQMGNALAFKSIIDEITLDQKNQYYTDIAYQYGRLVRKIYEFEPIASSSRTSTPLQQELQKYGYNKNQELDTQTIIGHIINQTTQSELFRNFLKTSYNLLEPQAKKQLLRVHESINKQIKKVGLEFTFTSYEDYIYLGYGVMEGAINVLPTDNILAFCKNNATLVMPEYDKYVYNITVVPDTLKVLYTIDNSADLFSSLFFNCYYSAFSVVDPKTYSNLFVGGTIVFNLLYNLGYMYTDVSALITRPLSDFATTKDYWRQMGKHVGDFVIRIFYRRPVVRGF